MRRFLSVKSYKVAILSRYRKQRPLAQIPQKLLIITNRLKTTHSRLESLSSSIAVGERKRGTGAENGRPRSLLQNESVIRWIPNNFSKHFSGHNEISNCLKVVNQST